MAFTSIEELGFFRELVVLCDEVWAEVQHWAWFEKKTVGSQLVRALDSAGANIVEAEGRGSSRDQLRHLYIARGSLQEARWWLMRAKKREMCHRKKPEEYVAAVESIHRRFNKLITYRRNRLAS